MVASGDFVFSLLTESPNNKTLLEVAAFCEGKSEGYRIWQVLINHWLALDARAASSQYGHGHTPTKTAVAAADPPPPSLGVVLRLVPNARGDAVQLHIEAAAPCDAGALDVADPELMPGGGNASPAAEGTLRGAAAGGLAGRAGAEAEICDEEAEALAGDLRSAMMEVMRSPLEKVPSRV